jgi:hypothetical protein
MAALDTLRNAHADATDAYDAIRRISDAWPTRYHEQNLSRLTLEDETARRILSTAILAVATLVESTRQETGNAERVAVAAVGTATTAPLPVARTTTRPDNTDTRSPSDDYAKPAVVRNDARETVEGRTFDGFMAAIDRVLSARIGVGVSDLADAPYRDMYDDGETPHDAAYRVVSEYDDTGFSAVW